MGFRDGTVAERLNMPTIRGLPVPHISLPEQRAIAATLGALDDKIELNRKMNATLEAMARALFRDWFVDFGPTRAKMEGAAPYLSPDLWSLFPARLDAEGKPEGWEMGTLNDLASLNPESWTARNAPAQVSYVDLANTKWGSIDKVEVYDWANAPSRARRILRAGDTIVGTVRPGNGSFCYVGEDGFTGSTGFAVLRPLQPRDRAFVWCAATSAENIDRLAHLADGGAYPAVRPDAVAATEVVIPGSGVLEAFRAAVSANLDLMEANKAESLTLAQTRDLLLPRLMSGELRVAEAERLAEEVA
jgi:type I restriction enzyme S subunit